MNGQSDLESGKIWVETKIREISANLSNPPRAFAWQYPEQRMREQFVKGSIGLKLYWGEAFKVIEFLETELRDVEATLEIQGWIDERLQNSLERK